LPAQPRFEASRKSKRTIGIGISRPRNIAIFIGFYAVSSLLLLAAATVGLRNRLGFLPSSDRQLEVQL